MSAAPNPKVRPIRKGLKPEAPKADKADEQPIRPDPVLPDPPAWLSTLGREAWAYLAPELEKNALLTKRDKYSFALHCESVAMAIESSKVLRANKKARYTDLMLEDKEHGDGRKKMSPAFRTYTQSYANVLRGAEHFGLSPRGRLGLTEGRGAAGVNHKANEVDPEDGEDLF